MSKDGSHLEKTVCGRGGWRVEGEMEVTAGKHSGHQKGQALHSGLNVDCMRVSPIPTEIFNRVNNAAEPIT